MQNLSQKLGKYVLDTLLDENINSSLNGLGQSDSSSMYLTSSSTQEHTEVDDHMIAVDHSLPTKCEICGSGGYDDQVLLCDGPNCTRESHMFCLRPIITEVPEGEWFCSLCSAQGSLPALTSLLEKYDTVSEHPSIDSEGHTETENNHDSTSHNIDPEISALLETSKSVGLRIKVFSEVDRNFHTGRILRVTKDSNTGQCLHLVQFQR